MRFYNKNYRVNRLFYIVPIFIIIVSSCTDLKEDVFSEITEDSFQASEDDITSLAASAYTPLRFVMDWQGYFDLQEESGDAFVTPTRPNGWDDAGIYKRMHFHKWDDQQWQPQNTWVTIFNGVNNINRVIQQVDTGELPMDEEESNKLIAEMRALRAFYYSILIDTHGNVPILTNFDEEVPEQNSREEVYNFIVSELEEVIPDLSEEVGPSTYGRINKWGAYQTLARVYLNAEVYVGEPQWEKCIEMTNKIINSGRYSLDPVYRNIFSTENENSPEIVFAIPYDETYAPQFGEHMKFLTPDHRKVFNMEAEPWGGTSANPQFIDSYDKDDNRLTDTWLMGLQYDAGTGEELFELVKEMPSIYDCTMYEGYRCGKYEIKDGAKASLSNDFPFYRYTDVLMMNAESLLRMGRADAAAEIVTEIRMRSFDNPEDAVVTGNDLKGDSTFPYGTLDKNGNIDDPGDQSTVKFGRFLDELGWEFAAEARRRTDMIRFGVFQTKSWYNHTPQGDYVTLFPIGIEQLNTNTNLKQNPGY